MIESITGIALLAMLVAVLGLLVYYGVLVKVIRMYGSDKQDDSLADRFTE
jgi:hypothetical protein